MPVKKEDMYTPYYIFAMPGPWDMRYDMNGNGKIDAMDAMQYLQTYPYISYSYDAFGNHEADANPLALDANPWRFNSGNGYYDAESGLVYNVARYLDTGTGRWLSEDPIKFGSNWYSFCHGDPINFTDPLGLKEPGEVLKLGSTGYSIEALQRQLNWLGHTDKDGNALNVNGEWDDTTEFAVRNFQEVNGLDVDGDVGDNTWDALGLRYNQNADGTGYKTKMYDYGYDSEQKENGGWRAVTTIGKSTVAYRVANSGVLSFGYAHGNNELYYTIIEFQGRGPTLATAMIAAGKAANPNGLQGRTVNGIHSEIVLRYAFYKGKIQGGTFSNIFGSQANAAIANMGGIGKYGVDGGDDNAFIFEKGSVQTVAQLLAYTWLGGGH